MLFRESHLAAVAKRPFEVKPCRQEREMEFQIRGREVGGCDATLRDPPTVIARQGGLERLIGPCGDGEALYASHILIRKKLTYVRAEILKAFGFADVEVCLCPEGAVRRCEEIAYICADDLASEDQSFRRWLGVNELQH